MALFYGRKTDGIFQNWDEVNSYVNKDGELLQPNAQPGDVRFVDVTSDGVINDQDRTKLVKVCLIGPSVSRLVQSGKASI